MPPPPEEILNCQQSGVLGAVAGTIGTIQAAEAIKYVAGFEDGLLTDRLLTYDARLMKFHTVDINRRAQCTGCGQAVALGLVDGSASDRV
jgi:molybdopterin/thiamine biosynthesis adenylyltransferase